MAAGDGVDAAAAGMDLVPGTALANTIDTELIKTRDYIAQGKLKDGALLPSKINGTVPITKGGTGSTSAAAARTALGVTAKNTPTTSADVQTDLDYLANSRPWAASRITPGTFKTGGAYTFPEALWAVGIFCPQAPPAQGAYAVAYIDGTGRLCKGAAGRADDPIAQLLDEVAALRARVAALEAP